VVAREARLDERGYRVVTNGAEYRVLSAEDKLVGAEGRGQSKIRHSELTT